MTVEALATELQRIDRWVPLPLAEALLPFIKRHIAAELRTLAQQGKTGGVAERPCPYFGRCECLGSCKHGFPYSIAPQPKDAT